MEVAKNFYGISAIPASLIKNLFLFFDFTGFRWGDYLGPEILQLKVAVLNFFHAGQIPDGLYSKNLTANRTLLEPLMGAGILGFLVFIPCLAWSLLKPLFKKKSKKTWILFGFGCLFVINLISMSYLLAFMTYSIRFIMFFMVLSSPILAYSYCKKGNPIKYIIIAFSLFYLMAISTHLWSRPLYRILPMLLNKISVSEIGTRAKCSDFEKDPAISTETCVLTEKIKNEYSKNNRILGFFNSEDCIYLIKELQIQGYNIDFALLEDVDKIDFGKYNIVITPNAGQRATYIKDYDNRKYDMKTINGKVFVTTQKPAMCLYVENQQNPASTDGEARSPFIVRCGISDYFLKSKNLEQFAEARLADKRAKDKEYYILFRNTKLPLYLKNN